jgi:hypothetical protein
MGIFEGAHFGFWPTGRCAVKLDSLIESNHRRVFFTLKIAIHSPAALSFFQKNDERL